MLTFVLLHCYTVSLRDLVGRALALLRMMFSRAHQMGISRKRMKMPAEPIFVKRKYISVKSNY